MANLNLSEFTEKLFVADADHTFIWDSAALISKRVSRNSWLNSGTLTSDAPVTISQTWGTTGTYTAFKVVATETLGANTASNLLELWSGSAATLKAYVTKSGSFVGGAVGINERSALSFPNNGSYSVGIYQPGSYKIQFSMSSAGPGSIAAGAYTGLQYEMTGGILSWGLTNQDIVLARDSQNTLALRNGAGVPQAFRVYNTFLGTTANEWFEIDWKTTAGLLKIGTTSGGTGVGRPIELNASGNYINFNIGTVVKFAVVSNRNLSYQSIEFNSDNTHDIGASGANRPRDIYAGGNGIFGGLISAQNGFRAPGSSQLIASANGIWRLTNSDANDFNRLQLGGTTDAFPAIARDGAGIKFTGAAAGSTSWIKVPPVAVGSLPLAATAGAGARAFVNDALSPTFGSAVTGGGAVLVPVYSTGSAWNVG